MATTWAITTPQIQEDFSSTVNQYPQASGTTIIFGTLCTLTTGKLNPIGANGAQVTTAGLLAGVALGPGNYAGGLGAGTGTFSGNIVANVLTFRARGGQRLVLNLTAAGANVVGAASMVGGKYGIYINASGIATVDTTNTTEAYFEVIKFGQENDQVLGAVGDTNPRVLVEVLASAVQ